MDALGNSSTNLDIWENIRWVDLWLILRWAANERSSHVHCSSLVVVEVQETRLQSDSSGSEVNQYESKWTSNSIDFVRSSIHWLKVSVKRFVDWIKTNQISKVARYLDKGFDPNFHISNDGKSRKRSPSFHSRWSGQQTWSMQRTWEDRFVFPFRNASLVRMCRPLGTSINDHDAD